MFKLYLSCIIQGQSYLCWAYASSTMLRRSLIDFFAKHKDDLDLNLTNEEKSEIETFIKSNKFHHILRKQIVMNPIPKRLQKDETGQEIGLLVFLQRVSHYLEI